MIIKNKSKTILLFFYGLLIAIISPFAGYFLNKRAKAGKELISRLNERLGQTNHPRPNGPLIWFHGASVGEIMLGLGVANEIKKANPNFGFLFTTTTITGAKIVENNLKDGFIHLFIPIDTNKATNDFLNYWSPDLGVFLEGEIWPNLLINAKKKNIKLALINARFTPKSIKNWNKHQKTSSYLFGHFDFCHAANKNSFELLKNLGANIDNKFANLKLNINPIINDTSKVEELKSQTKNRKIWLAASTHNGEDEIIIAAHKIIKAKNENALLILAPRHIERTAIIIDFIKNNYPEFDFIRRSETKEIQNNCDIYIWDTMGELPLAYEIAPISVVCGSLVDNIGGHNPIEPAQFQSAIISGKFVHNFYDIYENLENCGGTILIDKDQNLLADNINNLIVNENLRNQMIENATNYLQNNQNIMSEVINNLTNLMANKDHESA